MTRLMEQPSIAQPEAPLQLTEAYFAKFNHCISSLRCRVDLATPGEEMRILRLSASRIKTLKMENEESSDLLTNSTARQRDIQLKYGGTSSQFNPVFNLLFQMK